MVEPRVQRQRDRLIDGLIFAAFLLIACKYQLTALSGERPQIIANTDSGNVAGFIAGWLYAERFTPPSWPGERRLLPKIEISRRIDS